MKTLILDLFFYFFPDPYENNANIYIPTAHWTRNTTLFIVVGIVRYCPVYHSISAHPDMINAILPT
jgi:hypothetical protein